MEYTVTMRVSGTVDVTVEADSPDEAFELAQGESYDPAEVYFDEYEPVMAFDDDGVGTEYGIEEGKGT